MADNLTFTFDRKKAIEVILYIAHRINDPTYHSISKLLYFADKTHLERYGRFITGDQYYALKHGPIPSAAYDLMQESESGAMGFRMEHARIIVPLREPDMDILSPSDIECLNIAIELYGNAPYWKKTQDSHDSAWQKAWQNRGDKQSAPMHIEDIVQLLEDPDELLDFLKNRNV